MRSYGQFCALARSLDVVGDRWTLLIVRELFARDSRYSDLRDALPGIATNLLADRLRQLQADGLVEAYEAPPPIRATVYRLTPRGRELRPVVRSLVRWGMPLLETGQGEDRFRPQWMALAMRIMFGGVDIDDVAPLVVGIDTGAEAVTLEINEGITTYMGSPEQDADVHLQGEPEPVYKFLTGADDETSSPVTVTGADDATERLQILIHRARQASGDRVTA